MGVLGQGSGHGLGFVKFTKSTYHGQALGLTVLQSFEGGGLGGGGDEA